MLYSAFERGFELLPSLVYWSFRFRFYWWYVPSLSPPPLSSTNPSLSLSLFTTNPLPLPLPLPHHPPAPISVAICWNLMFFLGVIYVYFFVDRKGWGGFTKDALTGWGECFKLGMAGIVCVAFFFFFGGGDCD